MYNFKVKVAGALIILVLAVAAVCVGYSILSYRAIENRYESLYLDTAITIRDYTQGQLSNTAHTKDDYSQAVNSAQKYQFDDILVLTNDGALIYATSEGYAKDFVSSLGDAAVSSFTAENGSVLDVEINGERQLLIFAPTVKNGTERIATVISYSAHQKLFSTQLIMTVLECVLVVCIVLACGFALSVIYRNRNEYLPRVKPINNYVVTMYGNGSVITANSLFKAQFEVKSINDVYANKELSLLEALESGSPLICRIPNREGVVKQVVFSAVTSRLGYKLVGSDMTFMLDDYDAIKLMLRKQPETGLWKEDELIAKWKQLQKRGNFTESLFVQIRVRNIDYYKILFGEENVSRGTNLFVKKLREMFADYGELCALSTDNVACIIDDKAKRDGLLKEIVNISAELSRPVSIDDNMLQIDTRIGIVLLDAANAETPYEAVRIAGERAVKNAGDNPQIHFYILRSAVLDAKKHDLATKEGIIDMMTSGAVDVWFQPQYDIVQKKVIGFEALLRLVGERSKEINVFDFIAAAEKNGQIVELGKLIYERAMDFATMTQKLGLSISINVSPIQLMQLGFVDAFLNAYNARKLKPGSIDIEIVESTFIYSLDEVIRKLTILKNNGIFTHVDDFGVAYSSMLYLKQLPISTIKIDKAFIDGIVESNASYSIVKNIVNICRDLGLGCIAEGVETDEQVAKLHQMGCVIIQGFWMSSALPKEKAYEFIKEKNQ